VSYSSPPTDALKKISSDVTDDAKIPVYDSAGACNDDWYLKSFKIEHQCLTGYSHGFYAYWIIWDEWLILMNLLAKILLWYGGMRAGFEYHRAAIEIQNYSKTKLTMPVLAVYGSYYLAFGENVTVNPALYSMNALAQNARVNARIEFHGLYTFNINRIDTYLLIFGAP
jgi:hypothetical protein